MTEGQTYCHGKTASETENTQKCHRFPRLPESQYAMQRPTMSPQTMRRDTYTRSALSKTKDKRYCQILMHQNTVLEYF